MYLERNKQSWFKIECFSLIKSMLFPYRIVSIFFLPSSLKDFSKDITFESYSQAIKISSVFVCFVWL